MGTSTDVPTFQKVGTSWFYPKVGTSVDVPTFSHFQKGGDVGHFFSETASERPAPLPAAVTLAVAELALDPFPRYDVPTFLEKVIDVPTFLEI